MTDVQSITLVNTNGAVTVSFASASSPRNLMTTNNIAFSPYPSYRQWKRVFTQVWLCDDVVMTIDRLQDRTDGPIFMRGGVMSTANYNTAICRRNNIQLLGCGALQMLCDLVLD